MWLVALTVVRNGGASWKLSKRVTVVEDEGGGCQGVYDSRRKGRWTSPKCVIVVQNGGGCSQSV